MWNGVYVRVLCGWCLCKGAMWDGVYVRVLCGMVFM